MKKEYAKFKPNKVNWDEKSTEHLKSQLEIMEKELKTIKYPVLLDNGKWLTKETHQACFDYVKNLVNQRNQETIARCKELRKQWEKENVNKKLPENLLTKQKNVSNIGISNENKTTHSKQETKTMKKNTTTLNNTMLTANVAQLTDAVNKILARLDALEAKNVAPKKEFKKLRETAEEVKKETKKVKKVKKVKNPVIVNLQKKAMAMKETMTKAQLAAYEKMWSKKWAMVNKTIDKNKKEERSMAFAKGRIECAKNAIKMF